MLLSMDDNTSVKCQGRKLGATRGATSLDPPILFNLIVSFLRLHAPIIVTLSRITFRRDELIWRVNKMATLEYVQAAYALSTQQNIYTRSIQEREPYFLEGPQLCPAGNARVKDNELFVSTSRCVSYLPGPTGLSPISGLSTMYSRGQRHQQTAHLLDALCQLYYLARSAEEPWNYHLADESAQTHGQQNRCGQG